MKPLRNHPIICSERGSSVLELALVAPLFLLLMAGAIGFGQAWRVSSAVSSAAEAGALYGLANPMDTTGMARAAAADAGYDTGRSKLQTAATWGCECTDGSSAMPSCKRKPSCASGLVSYVDVTISTVYAPPLVVPGLPSSYTLHGHSRLRSAYEAR